MHYQKLLKQKQTRQEIRINSNSNYAGMNWNRQNNLGNQNLQNVNQMNQQVNMQNVNYNPNVNTNFVSTTNLNSNQNVLSIEEKNARLQEVEKTAPSAEMRLLTRHEIRLNNLEALNAMIPPLHKLILLFNFLSPKIFKGFFSLFNTIFP